MSQLKEKPQPLYIADFPWRRPKKFKKLAGVEVWTGREDILDEHKGAGECKNFPAAHTCIFLDVQELLPGCLLHTLLVKRKLARSHRLFCLMAPYLKFQEQMVACENSSAELSKDMIEADFESHLSKANKAFEDQWMMDLKAYQKDISPQSRKIDFQRLSGKPVAQPSAKRSGKSDSEGPPMKKSKGPAPPSEPKPAEPSFLTKKMLDEGWTLADFSAPTISDPDYKLYVSLARDYKGHLTPGAAASYFLRLHAKTGTSNLRSQRSVSKTTMECEASNLEFHARRD